MMDMLVDFLGELFLGLLFEGVLGGLFRKLRRDQKTWRKWQMRAARSSGLLGAR